MEIISTGVDASHLAVVRAWSFMKFRMCLSIGWRSLTEGVMRGSSIERQDKRRRRARLNGALRAKADGDAGSPGWGERLSVEPLWPRLPCPQVEGFGT